jgi:Flp pilus assembly pilin Flp
MTKLFFGVIGLFFGAFVTEWPGAYSLEYAILIGVVSLFLIIANFDHLPDLDDEN